MILESETYEYVLTLNDIINRERLAGIKAIAVRSRQKKAGKLIRKGRVLHVHEICTRFFKTGLTFGYLLEFPKRFCYLFIFLSRTMKVSVKEGEKSRGVGIKSLPALPSKKMAAIASEASGLRGNLIEGRGNKI